MKKRGLKHPGLYWAPRILSILFILFISMFALDVFVEGSSITQILIGLFMHLIPSFVLIIFLLISCRYEIFGGIAFILAGITYMLMVIRSPFEWYMISWSLIIAGPAFIVGILFFLSAKLNKRK